MSDDGSGTSIPGLPFDPRLVGPVDLAVAAVRRSHAWASDHSRELIAAVALVLTAQVAVFAWKGLWVLRPPRLPTWLLVGIGAIVFVSPWVPFVGILLARGLYRPNTTMLSVLSAETGDQRIKHVSTDRFEAMRIVNQNGEVRDRDYLETVIINGRRAYEVDSFDAERDVLVASSMAGRTNREVRADRRAIRAAKTDLERTADEAEELMINFPDYVREYGRAVVNRVLRTAQGVRVPDGDSLHDDLQESIRDVDPLDDLHSPGQGDEDDEQDDDDDSGAQDASLDVEGSDLIGIFGRAADADPQEAPADD